MVILLLHIINPRLCNKSRLSRGNPLLFIERSICARGEYTLTVIPRDVGSNVRDQKRSARRTKWKLEEEDEAQDREVKAANETERLTSAF